MDIESALDSSNSSTCRVNCNSSSTSRVSCNNKPPEHHEQTIRPLYAAEVTIMTG